MIVYDPKYLVPLIEQLDGHYKSLHTQIAHLEKAADKLIKVAWEDNESAIAFQKAHKNWENEFSDTATKLENMRDAAERALGNAQHADKQVYASFEGM